MGIELKSKIFVEQMADMYFTKRDINGLLDKMRTTTSWLGTGEQEISSSLHDAAIALEREFTEYSGSFIVTSMELYITALSEEACVVYGLLRAHPKDDLVEEQNLHISIVCVETPDGIKLAHCNISRPDYMLESNNYYLPPQSRADNKTLRGTLESRERWLQNLTQNIPGGVHQCLNDPNLTLIAMSDSFLDMFGYTHEEIEKQFDNKFINMIYPADRAEMLRTVNEQLQNGKTIEAEYRVMSKSNGPLWILDKGRLLIDENSEECFYCILIEITERKQEQEELRLSLERHRIIMNQAVDIIFEWDIAADVLDFSGNWRKKFGYDPIEKGISKKIPLSENIHPDDMPAFIKIMHDTAAGVPYSEAEFRIRDITGRYTWSRIRATAQFDNNGRAIKAVGVINDINIEKAERLALMELANKDALTGLYNKAAIKAQVEGCMLGSRNNETQALLIIDVDNFKQVNDTYGHLCGDSVLSNVAEVLKRHFRSSDLIGRIGGDEFLVYLPRVAGESAVYDKVHSLLDAVASIRPTPNSPPISCSIGAVVFPFEDGDYFAQYKAADFALYYQKNNGRNGISFYDRALMGGGMMSELPHSAVGDSIDSEQGTVEQKLTQYTFQMLYQSIDVHTAVNRLLEIVGRAYGVSRVYIFESSKDGLYCDNTFEWCAPGIESELDNLQGIRYEEDLGGYLTNFGSDGVFYCHDIHTLHPSLYNVLAPQGIRSLLQCAVLDRGKFKGYVGFDECKENCIWSKDQISALTLIANILSVFLIKLRLEERLENQENFDK